MKQLLLFVVSGLTLFFVVACATGEPAEDAPNTEADIAAIAAIVQEFDAAVIDGDMDRMLALFTGDSVRMAPEQNSFVGHDGIREEFTPNFEAGSTVQRASVSETHVLGDVAVATGLYGFTFTPADGSEEVTQNGKWMGTFRREADGWKMYKTIWNTDHEFVLPAAPE